MKSIKDYIVWIGLLCGFIIFGFILQTILPHHNFVDIWRNMVVCAIFIVIGVVSATGYAWYSIYHKS